MVSVNNKFELLFNVVAVETVFLYWLVLAGEDRHRCSHSRAHGTWLPKPPGSGRSCCHPCGKARHFPYHLQCQLPCRLKNCPSGEEHLDLETLPPALPCCYRDTITLLLPLLILNSPVTHLQCPWSNCFLPTQL